MVWLLNCQGMKNCKSTERFCRSILAIYTDYWSTFWYVYCCYVCFFLGNSQMCASLQQQHIPLTTWPTWIGILWKWASVLTKLARNGECRLALFHAIRIFLANKIYHFSRLSHQTAFSLGQPAPYNQLLIQLL